VCSIRTIYIYIYGVLGGKSNTIRRHLKVIHLYLVPTSTVKETEIGCNWPSLFILKTKILEIKKLKILLIEDDTIEVMKFKRAIAKLEMAHELTEAKNGEEALLLLKDKGVLPDIIFLDLNMPRINGLEFLKMLKDDEVLRFLPTIILTTSSNRKDVLASYSIGVAGYIIKPLKYDDYVEKIKIALQYWSMNELIKA